MPELPEVETIRRDLRAVLVGKQIKGVRVRTRKLVTGSTQRFQRAVRGRTITGIRRRGKLLIFDLSSGDHILIHLKMTGQLFYQRRDRLVAGGHGQEPPLELPDRHTHVTFDFHDGSKLYFNDLRQFGYVKLVDEAGLAAVLAAFGVEPLSAAFTRKGLRDLLRGRTTALKNVLLNQQGVAGLGNIYVDEAAFYAGVRPTRRADRVTEAEIKKLYRGIRHILQQSLKERGTTFNNYRDGRGRRGGFVRKLKVYGRAGEACRRCKVGVIKKTKVNGRGTHYCPACQH